MAPGSRHGFGVVAIVIAIGCGDLAEPPGVERTPSVHVVTVFEPPLIDERSAPIVHLKLSGLPPGSDPPPMVIEGPASERNIRDLAEGDIGDTLRKRIVETAAWVRDDGTWLVVPHERLQLGDKYSVVAPSVRWFQEFDVIDSDETPELSRIWPPKDAGGALALWCLGWPASGTITPEPRPFALLPEAPGVIDRGVFDGWGEGCVRWRSDPFVQGTVVVPPPLLKMGDGPLVRVDPSPIALEQGTAQYEMPSCELNEQAIGPSCVRVLDDRAVVTVRDANWLIGLEMGERRWVNTVGPNEPWVVRPLEPSSELEGVLRVVSSQGEEQRFDISWKTLQSSAHVIINEVMANPAGPEPHQEWVELYNDGTLDVSLAGWRLQDAGGSTELPSVILRSGGYGLVVGEGYESDSWVDRPPASGTLLVRVSSVGKSGLSNGGEPVRLVGPDGVTASAIPAIASKEQGWSIVRVAPDALDSLSRSFGFGMDGGTPGAPNDGWVSLDY
jgi:Lamin Tail Domain